MRGTILRCPATTDHAPMPLPDSRPEWIEPAPIDPDSSWRSLDANALVSAILYRRGLRTRQDADAFMHPERAPAPDPLQVPNMERAVARLARAIRDGERIGIFGDYDVDGISSTALLAQALRSALPPERVLTRIPTRHEGYGLNEPAIAAFRHEGVSLVVAVDCGSTDHDHAAIIAARGMDLIVVDHHHMPDAGPRTAIVVSPQLNGDGTYHDLTAVGVAYLLVSALASQGIPIAPGGSTVPTQYLDLVALGTVADVAPLVGVNRHLVHKGVELVRSGRRPGIAALMAVAGIEPPNATSTAIAFKLAPRLNAAGRMGSPKLAFDLLMSDDRREAQRLALALEDVNARRRRRTAQVLDEALGAVRQIPGWATRPVVAVHHDGWETGLVGAVASRLVEDLGRPVLLFRKSGDLLSGSARSVEGFNLVTALAAIGDRLERFGGHSLAAGVTLRADALPHLEQHLAGLLEASGISVPVPKRLRIDATLPPACISLDSARAISRMEPFGRGNEQPLLLVRDASLLQYSAMGKERQHLRLTVAAGGRQLEAVAWNAAGRSRELVARRRVDLVGRLEINPWNGQERLQMILEDFRAG